MKPLKNLIAEARDVEREAREYICLKAPTSLASSVAALGFYAGSHAMHSRLSPALLEAVEALEYIATISKVEGDTYLEQMEDLENQRKFDLSESKKTLTRIRTLLEPRNEESEKSESYRRVDAKQRCPQCGNRMIYNHRHNGVFTRLECSEMNCDYIHGNQRGLLKIILPEPRNETNEKEKE